MKKITIKSAEVKTLFLENLENTEFTLEKNSILIIAAILEKGWKEACAPTGMAKKLTFNLSGENSILEFTGIIIAKQNEKFNFEITVNHLSPNVISFHNFRSILSDNAEINYKGNLIITKNAQKTETFLSHHSLNFSKSGKLETTPCLEIEANNVKAGHAVTIGKIDNNQLLYMTSRGLDEKTAKKLLIESFLKTDLIKIKDKKLKQIALSKLDDIKLKAC